MLRGFYFSGSCGIRIGTPPFFHYGVVQSPYLVVALVSFSFLRGGFWMFYTLLKLSEKNNIFHFLINLCIPYTSVRETKHKNKERVRQFVIVCGFVFCFFFVWWFFLWTRVSLQERPSKGALSIDEWVAKKVCVFFFVKKGKSKRKIIRVKLSSRVCVCRMSLIYVYLNLKFTLALAFSSSDHLASSF